MYSDNKNMMDILCYIGHSPPFCNNCLETGCIKSDWKQDKITNHMTYSMVSETLDFMKAN
jgi:hypothetical protein